MINELKSLWCATGTFYDICAHSYDPKGQFLGQAGTEGRKPLKDDKKDWNEEKDEVRKVKEEKYEKRIKKKNQLV